MDSHRDTNSKPTLFDRESILTLCYVLAASYLVLQFEYENGGFLYYFFKSKLYYANFNKIILPVYFWICSLLYMACLVLPKKTGWSQEKIFHFLRHILFPGNCHPQLYKSHLPALHGDVGADSYGHRNHYYTYTGTMYISEYSVCRSPRYHA